MEILNFNEFLLEMGYIDDTKHLNMVSNEEENIDDMSMDNNDEIPDEGSALPDNSATPKKWETENGEIVRKFKFKSNDDQMIFLDDIKILFKEYNYFPEIMIKDNWIRINFGGMEEMTAKKGEMSKEINLSYDTYNLDLVDMDSSPEDEEMLNTYSTFTDKAKK